MNLENLWTAPDDGRIACLAVGGVDAEITAACEEFYVFLHRAVRRRGDVLAADMSGCSVYTGGAKPKNDIDGAVARMKQAAADAVLANLTRGERLALENSLRPAGRRLRLVEAG
jgi:hypothetical protein